MYNAYPDPPFGMFTFKHTFFVVMFEFPSDNFNSLNHTIDSLINRKNFNETCDLNIP